jgi:hypothetical protein
MPRLRTVTVALAVVVLTDVTWDGTSLRISIGWPGRRPVVSFVVPARFMKRPASAFVGKLIVLGIHEHLDGLKSAPGGSPTAAAGARYK